MVYSMSADDRRELVRMAEGFAEKMAAMGNMSEEEITHMMDEIKDVCQHYCNGCPSYDDTGETKLAFCTIGKSDKITEDLGCMCTGCPVTGKLSLESDFHCIKGSAREQAGMG
jgi:hypothetical protein